MWRTSKGDRTLIGKEADAILLSVGYMRDMVTAAVDLSLPHPTDVELFSNLQPTQQLAILHEVAHALLDPHTAAPELTAAREATVYVLYRELLSLVELEIEYAQGSDLELSDSAPTANRQAVLDAFLETEFDQVFVRDAEGDSHLDQLSKDELDPESRPPLTNCLKNITPPLDVLTFKLDHQLDKPKFQSELGDLEEFRRGFNDGFDEDDLPTADSENLDEWESLIESLADAVLWDRDFEYEAAFADDDPNRALAIKSAAGIDENYFSVPAPDSTSAEFEKLDRELLQLTARATIEQAD